MGQVQEDLGGDGPVVGDVEGGAGVGEREGVRHDCVDGQALGQQGDRLVELGVEAEGAP